MEEYTTTKDSRKRLIEKGKEAVKTATGYAILGGNAFGFYKGIRFISEIGPPPGTGNMGDALFYPITVLPLSLLAFIGGSIGISLVRRSRTCYNCDEKGRKREMVKICVPDGMRGASRYVWSHKNCAEKYLKESENVRGPFTLVHNIAASHTPKKTLEKLSRDNS